ncbi:hypothetical protein [Vibrio agarivorans]|uniref:hypothetical protein n=1 Tax=Vibrio agarivorans TaxID=153622 RepID=UPI0025B29D83|nr:hypothetical protein [Vibrio agarivorans]MDN3660449.1 hypothetical protein [Vibrio agarivorans]
MCQQINRFIEGFSSKSTLYQYKTQSICDFNGGVLGYELLIDNSSSIEVEIVLGMNVHKDITFSSSANNLIDRLKDAVINSDFVDLNGKKVFINIERSNLCDITLIARLIELKGLLVRYNSALVVEITERNTCGACVRILSGLALLKDNGISLAADDFDVYNGDFREEEVSMGIYDYIKIRAPKTCYEIGKVVSSLEHIKERVILEMVESAEVLKSISYFSSNVYGLQGYYFDLGKPVSI